jgi:dihydroflavonol-4-reductase
MAKGEKGSGKKGLAEAAKKMQFRVSTRKALAEAEEKKEAPLSLVTGASGRLGSYLVKALLEKGERVRVLHRQGSSAEYPEGVEVAEGDLADKESLLRAVDGTEYVYHLAALVSYTAPLEELLDVNYRGTRNLLEACRSRAYRLRRFVFVSSISVYGKEIDSLPANEGTEMQPSDNYGVSKMMAEQVVAQYGAKVPAAILRPAVIYGEGFDEAYIPVLKALEGGKMQLIDGGKNVIPFVHVLDVVQAILLAAKADRAGGNTYVIAGGERLTQKQVFEIACKYLGVQPPASGTSSGMLKFKLGIAKFFGKLSGSEPQMIGDYIDVLAADRQFDIAKAKAELGYAPRVKLEDGIREMVEYYRRKKVV